MIVAPDGRWSRCDIKSVALLANVLAAQQAKEQGAQEAVFVRDGVVTEGSHTNVGAVFGGELWTAPESNFILAGITRKVVLELATELGIAVRQTAIPVERFRAADEIMILGTTTEVMPVVKVDGQPVGSGTPGPVTRRLQEAFQRLLTLPEARE